MLVKVLCFWTNAESKLSRYVYVEFQMYLSYVAFCACIQRFNAETERERDRDRDRKGNKTEEKEREGDL